MVVLETPYGQSPADLRSPEALTVGHGRALVYTAGTVIEGTWARRADDRVAALRDLDGEAILLSPGQTWIELPRPGGATTVG